MSSTEIPVFFWFRRDLRWEDNAALYAALSQHDGVQPVFIFDENILKALEDKDDARVTFIWDHVQKLKQSVASRGGTVWTWFGDPVAFWESMAVRFPRLIVYAGEDYEPGYPMVRDARVAKILKAAGGRLELVRDHVLVAPTECSKPDGTPYTVYTPFSKCWLSLLHEERLSSKPSENYLHRLATGLEGPEVRNLEEMGFVRSSIKVEAPRLDENMLATYDKTRNFPGHPHGVSRLSMHLRFGTISVRALARKARDLNLTFLKELGWREFFIHVLYHFPHTVNQEFRPEFQRLPWRHDEAAFEKWCAGHTGVPLVDAGMRELNATGYMHNRVRMVVASFLTKDLLIDWRWGERYFARKLLDFELASNVGNWQWAAGTGCDAAPYFRIFNPTLQQEKFDPEGVYVRRWVPEVHSSTYPRPMIDHHQARDRALEFFRSVQV
ncbi:MAG: DNA photolyase family protein [Flavobacteriales bacterium]|nr:DNA photolyase family protein [Flavobacteriales bacterium]MDW8432432.1 deoxyribodipyrimidine photo-lyase [Flavobacteriales bacterium]